jgi:hypothetical protein
MAGLSGCQALGWSGTLAVRRSNGEMVELSDGRRVGRTWGCADGQVEGRASAWMGMRLDVRAEVCAPDLSAGSYRADGWKDRSLNGSTGERVERPDVEGRTDEGTDG